MKKNDSLLVTSVVFTLFMVEAILHYNMGQQAVDSEDHTFDIPPMDTLVKMAAGVGVFSILSGAIVEALRK